MQPKKSNDSSTTKPKSGKLTDEEQVREWMAKLEPGLKPEIEEVRKIIKSASRKISERIKWNAPSYYYKEDLVTFGPTRAADKIILVFHHPNIVKIKSPLLTGDYKDRRLTYLNSVSEISAAKKELVRIVSELVKMLDK